MINPLHNLIQIINDHSLSHVFAECLTLISMDGYCSHINATGLSMLEADSFRQLEGIPLVRFVDPVFAPDFDDLFRRVKLGEQVSLEFKVIGLKGGTPWLELRLSPVRLSNGDIVAIFGTARDITDRKRTEHALASSRQLLSESQAIAQIGGWEIDLRTKTLNWTDETYRIHDTTPEEFNPTIDTGISYFSAESQTKLLAALERATEFGEAYDLELEKLTVKGRRISVRTTCNVTMSEGKAIRLTGIIQDISEQKIAQQSLKNAYAELERSNGMLEHIAHYDALTHLPNRVLLADRMQQAMHQCQRRGDSLAVAFLDLDGFKTVNDMYGHSIGDQLLITVAARLRAALREGDTLARIGGDEFVAILSDLEDSKDCNLS